MKHFLFFFFYFFHRNYRKTLSFFKHCRGIVALTLRILCETTVSVQKNFMQRKQIVVHKDLIHQITSDRFLWGPFDAHTRTHMPKCTSDKRYIFYFLYKTYVIAYTNALVTPPAIQPVGQSASALVRQPTKRHPIISHLLLSKWQLPLVSWLFIKSAACCCIALVATTHRIVVISFLCFLFNIFGLHVFSWPHLYICISANCVCLLAKIVCYCTLCLSACRECSVLSTVIAVESFGSCDSCLEMPLQKCDIQVHPSVVYWSLIGGEVVFIILTFPTQLKAHRESTTHL